MPTQPTNQRTRLSLLPMTALGFIAIVFSYGCGHKNSVQVQPVEGEAQSRSLEACGSKIGAAYEAIVKGDVDKKQHVVEICQLVSPEPGETRREPKYEVSQLPSSYKVSRSGDKINVKLALLVTVPNETVENDFHGIRVALEKCAKLTETQWKKSFERKATSLEITVGLNFEDRADREASILSLVKGEKAGSLVMAHWPSRGELYPFGRPSEVKKCRPNSTAEGRKCRDEEIQAANEPFCAAFAVMSAAHLGLSSDDALCGAKGNATNPKEAFVTQAMEHAGNPSQFREKARFTENDLKTILTPVCANAKKTQTADTRPIRVGGPRPQPEENL